MIGKKLSRSKQIEFLKLWASLKRDGSSDRVIISELKKQYLDLFGDGCPEYQFCEHCEFQLENWSGGMHQAMEGWFDADLVLLVSTSKRADSVDAALQMMLEQTQQWQSLHSEIIKTVVGNGFLIVFALGIAILISTYGLNFIMEGLPKDKVSSYSMAFHSFGVFTENWGVLILFLLGLVLAVNVMLMLLYVGEHRQSLDNILPGFRYYSANCSSKFFALLDVLVSSAGMPLREALEVLDKSRMLNPYITYHVDEMLYRLEARQSSKRGETFDTLDTGLLPSRLRLRLRVMSLNPDVADRSVILATIRRSLVSDFGDTMRSQMAFYAKAVRYGSAVVGILSVLALFDVLFTKIELLQVQGM